MSRVLVVAGLVLVILGLLWPWLGKIGLGRLPGDILIERGNSRFYFPLTSCVLLSVIGSVLWWWWRR